MNNTIDILKCSAGDPHGVHARGDGMSYSGVIESLHRLPGESDADFEKRANARADELEETI